MARTLTRGVLLTSVALACGAASPAKAQEGVFFKNLLGNLGVVDKEQEAIHYRERAPLAVPPKLDLPRPAAGTARAAAWPQDADVVRRKRETAERQQPVPFPNDNRPSQGAVMSRDELARTHRPTQNEKSGPREVYGDGRMSTWIDPDILKRVTGGGGDTAKLKHGEEPERDTLLQPPTGYRMPASNAPIKATKSDPVPYDKGNNPEKEVYTESD